MKKDVLKILVSFLLMVPLKISAQVKDIGQSFKNHGYIQNINYDEKVMLVNFITDKEILTEVVMIKNTRFSNSNNDSLVFTDLKYNDEINVEGERFTVDKYSEATKITRIEQSVRSINNGRIDFINGEIACVDGNRIKLKSGKKIKGQKKTGYSNKSFDAFTDLKYGDRADVKGKYEKEGYFLADEFTIAPENDKAEEMIADSIDMVYYEKFYPLWNDKAKRARFFNTDVPGIGKVTANADIQEYINTLGNKLVPDYMKSKINFVFVVVDNPGFNANVRANGLCYVYTGLLKRLENEAQLAAVLGHEIAHVIYKHISKEARDREKSAKLKALATDGSKVGNNVLHKMGNVFKTKNKNESDSERVVINKNREDLTTAVINLADRQLSTFSVDEESQADRVGLNIMALAGYDPRQAPVVWRNIYELYGKLSDVKKPTLANQAREELTKDNTKNKSNKKSNTTTATAEVINILIKWKATDFKAKSYKTHPDHLNRFEELNRLISLYWNNDSILQSTATGEENYKAQVKKLAKGK
jgi:Zn-dependent protease with chaperone function